jgi:DNA helicase-2/ATP-dependent DNA helicase PcrA
VQRLRRESGGVVPAVERVTAALGFSPDAVADSAEEVTRQADLGRLRALAAEFAAANPEGDAAAFLAELARRFSAEESGRGVNLMTYHRAKGLDFDAVFLPRLLDGELPFRSGRNRAPADEERRLLYVGVTRARRHLFLTWPVEVVTGRGARAARSPFVDEIMGSGTAVERHGRRAARVVARKAAAPADPAYEALKRWRRERAVRDGVPAYVVFHDSTLSRIATLRPVSLPDLRSIAGVGPAKLDRYGLEVLEVLAAVE